MTIFNALPRSAFSRLSFAYIFIFISVVIYFEFFQVWTNSSSWRTALSSNDSEIRILLVADPQLLGEHGELPFIGMFTRWHADRYIAQNYRVAKERTKPHVIIFLGDLFDEGSTATETEAARYLQRFHSVFQLGRYSREDDALYIYLPGDNDVGGEGWEKIRPEKVHWFNSSIGDLQSPVLYHRLGLHLKFSQTNFLFANYPEVFLNSATVGMGHSQTSSPHPIHFALSHYPCMQAYTTCSNLLVAQKPNVILSSHTHKAAYFQYNSEGKVQYNLPSLLQPGTDSIDGTREAAKKMGIDITFSSLRLNLRNLHHFHEIVTPTCSYRMGEKNVGYGFLTIDSSGGYAHYQVLWLPDGFKPLYVYITLYVISKVIFTPWVLWKVLTCFCPRLKRFLNRQGVSKNISAGKTHLV